jgi:hypothetical protein
LKQHFQIEQWKISADRPATQTAYGQSVGFRCDCSGCRNFYAVRRIGFPLELLTLLDQLGIDPNKVGEAYEQGLVREGPPRLVQYGGWYHFVGAIEEDGGNPVQLNGDWSVWFNRQIASPEAAFRWEPLVQLEFEAQIHWIIDEPYPPE